MAWSWLLPCKLFTGKKTVRCKEAPRGQLCRSGAAHAYAAPSARSTRPTWRGPWDRKSPACRCCSRQPAVHPHASARRWQRALWIAHSTGPRGLLLGKDPRPHRRLLEETVQRELVLVGDVRRQRLGRGRGSLEVLLQTHAVYAECNARSPGRGAGGGIESQGCEHRCDVSLLGRKPTSSLSAVPEVCFQSVSTMLIAFPSKQISTGAKTRRAPRAAPAAALRPGWRCAPMRPSRAARPGCSPGA